MIMKTPQDMQSFTAGVRAQTGVDMAWQCWLCECGRMSQLVYKVCAEVLHQRKGAAWYGGRQFAQSSAASQLSQAS